MLQQIGKRALGANNRVNKAMRATILGERVRDFFHYHNGVTAICDSAHYNQERSTLSVKGLSVVNGCQSINDLLGF